MNELDTKYTVILGAPEDLQVPSIAKALSQFKKISLTDAAYLARISWGFIGKDLSETEARELCNHLSNAGLRGEIINQSSAPTMPEKETVSSMDIADDALRLITGTGLKAKTVTVLFENITVLAAAAVKVVTTQKVKIEEGPTKFQKAINIGIVMTTGLPLKIGKKREVEKQETSTELLFYFDLISRQPAAHYRIDAQNLDYSFLRGKREYSVIGNFKILLAEMARKIPGALRNKGIRALLERQPLYTLGYESLTDFDLELRWLSALSCLRGLQTC